jgi:transposase-like protein
MALLRRRSLLDRTKRLLSSCDGIAILDGKHIRIQGKLHTLFVAWDRGLGLPIHFMLKDGGEKELWYWKMMTDLKHIGYVPKGFVSDGIVTLKEYLSEAFPDLPHQRCTVHVFLAARAKLGGGGKTSARTDDLIDLVQRILWSGSLSIAKRRFFKLWNTLHLTKKEQTALSFVWSALPECFVCRDRKWRHLHLPRSSNAIENVMGQVEARLKTRRGTKSLASAELLVNELLLQIIPQSINR